MLFTYQDKIIGRKVTYCLAVNSCSRHQHFVDDKLIVFSTFSMKPNKYFHVGHCAGYYF